MRAPNAIKNIPLPVVRALPTLYYYGCFANLRTPSAGKKIFVEYLKYFQKALILLSEFVPDARFEQMIVQSDALVPDSPASISEGIYKLTLQLSQICQQNRDRIQKALERKNINQSLLKLFAQTVEKRNVLVIDNQIDSKFTNMIVQRLKNDCYYRAAAIFPAAETIAEAVMRSDFLLFLSAAPQNIHEQVDWLKVYNKPGLVLGHLQKDGELNRQIIRNGAWLRSRGIYVLFKIFTPLRLFTTIDKIYVRFLLQKH